MAQIHQMPQVHLILGGARSGKSGYAEQIALSTSQAVTYVATAQALDSEMSERIAHHQTQRPNHWLTIEEPIQLAQVIKQHDDEGQVILVDCLTLWLMNIIYQEQDVQVAIDDFLAALQSVKGTVLLVSNEISMGVVPMGKTSRDYVDSLGRLHQAIGRIADKVTLMVAGIPMAVKS